MVRYLKQLFFCSRGQRDKPALLVYLLYLTCRRCSMCRRVVCGCELFGCVTTLRNKRNVAQKSIKNMVELHYTTRG